MPVRVLVLLSSLLVVAIAAGCAHRGTRAYGGVTSVPGADSARGKAVYDRECAACHGQQGSGGQIGPSLKSERTRRNYAAVRAIVLDPQGLMPKLYPSRLTRAEVRDVSAYVESL